MGKAPERLLNRIPLCPGQKGLSLPGVAGVRRESESLVSWLSEESHTETQCQQDCDLFARLQWTGLINADFLVIETRFRAACELLVGDRIAIPFA
jgi:hypothetical protein